MIGVLSCDRTEIHFVMIVIPKGDQGWHTNGYKIDVYMIETYSNCQLTYRMGQRCPIVECWKSIGLPV